MYGATYWRLQQAEWEAKHPFNAKLDKIVPSVAGVIIVLSLLAYLGALVTSVEWVTA